MKYYTDSPSYAARILGNLPGSRTLPARNLFPAPGEAGLSALARELFRAEELFTGEVPFPAPWQHLFLVASAPRSQYDLLIQRSRKGPPLPDGILCLAGEGTGFHGFAGRPWTSVAGNLHLSAFLAPGREIPHFVAGFLILSAVSAAQAIEALGVPGFVPAIKWVNDVLVDGAKVCGVLAQTQTAGRTVTGAVLGVGMNVRTRPAIARDPFVPRVAALSEFVPDPVRCHEGEIFGRLAGRLGNNYRELLENGHGNLLAYYLARSAVLGRPAVIFDQEREIARGTVRAIGQDLELYLEGREAPLFGNRLALL